MNVKWQQRSLFSIVSFNFVAHHIQFPIIKSCVYDLGCLQYIFRFILWIMNDKTVPIWNYCLFTNSLEILICVSTSGKSGNHQSNGIHMTQTNFYHIYINSSSSMSQEILRYSGSQIFQWFVILHLFFFRWIDARIWWILAKQKVEILSQ